MDKNTKELFAKRFSELFPNKRLLAIHLDGFSHAIFYDDKKDGAKVEQNEIRCAHYTGCASEAKYWSGDWNSDNTVKFFEGFPNYQYQNNAQEIVFVQP